MDISQLISSLLSGSPVSVLVLAIVAVTVLRGGTGGGLVDGVLDSLRQLLNRPTAVAIEPEKLDSCDEQCGVLSRLAATLAQQRQPALAKDVLDLVSRVHQAHDHDTTEAAK